MSDTRSVEATKNHARYRPGQASGHYESYFLRANHPKRPLAFWIRYTLFSPEKRPSDAIGELWAVFFNGETGRHIAVKTEVPIREARFDPNGFDVAVGGATLSASRLEGAAASRGHAIAWTLSYEGDEAPVLLLPASLYSAPLPKAKSLVSVPLARFSGTLVIDGEPLDVTGWVGSQNHNWGSKHTDDYAWGQVAGFDEDPSAFLEVATARLRLGGFWTPFMTPLVLRYGGREIAHNTLLQSVRADGSFSLFDWRFSSTQGGVTVEGRIHAPREAFVGLSYFNPPGGIKHCLNTKIARCELSVRDASSGENVTLSTESRAAFEILTDLRDHGVSVLA